MRKIDTPLTRGQHCYMKNQVNEYIRNIVLVRINSFFTIYPPETKLLFAMTFAKIRKILSPRKSLVTTLVAIVEIFMTQSDFLCCVLCTKYVFLFRFKFNKNKSHSNYI